MRLSGICVFLFAAALPAAEIRGTVVDPSGAAIPGAQVSAVNRTGVVAQTSAAASGAFELKLSTLEGIRLVATAPGFSTRTLEAVESGAPLTIQLQIAPQVDTVRVVGSAMDVAASEQGGSVTIIPREEIRQRNEPFAADLLRYIPSAAVSATGQMGGISQLFLRGGYPTFTLVQIDGVPVNAFGGNFDFAHIPAESLDRIEVIRGPQSAVYGPYANGGVVNFVTRSPEQAANIDVVAEGGTYHERRFGISGSGTVKGFGIAASASRLDTDGPVRNSDYTNQGLTLNVMRRFRHQQVSFHGDFNSNENGVPGPWGSDPAHTFTGLDLVSRNKNNFSDYSLRWQADLSPRVRQEASGAFFLNNNGYTSPYGFNYNKDIRGQAETRTVVSVNRHYTLAAGAAFTREEIKNTYITDANFRAFPLQRNDAALYLENRFQFGARLFLNAGVRGETLRTAAIPADGFSRPFFPKNDITSVNPKFAAAYVLGATRLHGAVATGLRPASGLDLAYTDNPALKPERTTSFEAGLERSLLSRRVTVDGTYFYNRYSDLIVILGGSLSRLSSYHSDNLANSRAQGGEFSTRVRPARWIFVTGSYTYLKTEILAVRGSRDLAPAPFRVGQQLLRRPAHSGSAVATFARGRITADVSGYLRGAALDVEPSFGAGRGLFENPGYANVGINLNYRLNRGFSVYGNLRNALNQHYEEVFGYPSPRLNFVAGMKWSL